MAASHLFYDRSYFQATVADLRKANHKSNDQHFQTEKMDLHHRTHPPVIFVDNFSDDPMDFERDNGLILPVVEGLELVSFMDSTPCQSTRMLHASVPVTPPRQCRQMFEIAEFSCSSSCTSSSDDEGDETLPESDLDAPDFSDDEDDLSFLLYCGDGVRFPSHRRVQDLRQPLDPDSRQLAVTYYCALTKLATSMRLSEETRSGILLQRRVLYDVYGHLDTNDSLLCGSGAASDYQVSRNALMSYICDAMEQPPPLLRD
jgi:hypothetical protein